MSPIIILLKIFFLLVPRHGNLLKTWQLWHDWNVKMSQSFPSGSCVSFYTFYMFGQWWQFVMVMTLFAFEWSRVSFFCSTCIRNFMRSLTQFLSTWPSKISNCKNRRWNTYTVTNECCDGGAHTCVELFSGIIHGNPKTFYTSQLSTNYILLSRSANCVGY